MLAQKSPSSKGRMGMEEIVRFKPVAFQAEHRFRREGGKLRYEYDGASFDVDVETMRRTGGSDRYPPFVSVEQ